MPENRTPSQRLMEAFFRFSKLHMLRPKEGFRPPEMAMLHTLHRSIGNHPAGLKVSDLSQLMHVTPPMVTQLVNALEARSLVKRSMDSTDRRAVRVRITEEGCLVMRRANDAFLTSFDQLVAHLGHEKSVLLADLLTEVFEFVSSGKATVAESPSLQGKQAAGCACVSAPTAVSMTKEPKKTTDGGDALL